MNRIVAAFAFFYITATVAVTADRTLHAAQRYSSVSIEQNYEEARYWIDAYPHFREAQKRRVELWAVLPPITPLPQPAPRYTNTEKPELATVPAKTDRPTPPRGPPASQLKTKSTG